MNVLSCMYVFLPCLCLVSVEVRRGYQNPWNKSYRQKILISKKFPQACTTGLWAIVQRSRPWEDSEFLKNIHRLKIVSN